MNRNDDMPGYQDIFTDGDLPREPRIMKDGTSVRWPPGWSLEEAALWRQEHNLESPEARRKRFRLVGDPEEPSEETIVVHDMSKWRDV